MTASEGDNDQPDTASKNDFDEMTEGNDTTPTAYYDGFKLPRMEDSAFEKMIAERINAAVRKLNGQRGLVE